MVRKVGTSGRDILRGTALDDILFGLGNNDRLFGLGGNDRIIGGSGNDLLDGGQGDDILRAGDGNDHLRGGVGNDRLFGDDGNDILRGNAGDDRLIGGDGNDRLFGQTGNDILHGNAGDDRLVGGDGDDRMFGQTGNDILIGGAGTDILIGGDGDDSLVGGADDDDLSGGAGTDTAHFSGPRADYDIVQIGPDLQVTHARGTLLDGTDIVRADVERLVFSDVVIDLTANASPVGVDDSATTDEDSAVPFGTSVLDNDTDVEASAMLQTLSVSEVNGVPGDVGSQITLTSGALLTMNSDGTYEYDPNGAFDSLSASDSTTDSFDYTVSDGAGGTATATVTITINGTNDGPVAANATINAFGTENAPVAAVDLLQGVTDPENDSLSVSNLAQTAGRTGVHSLVGNTIIVDTNAFDDLADGQTETLTFTFDVDDGNGGTLARTVNVEITGTNDAPNAGATLGVGAGEDSGTASFDLLANATDPDTGQTATLAVVGVSLTQVVGPVLASPAVLNGNNLEIDTTQFQSLAEGEELQLAYIYDIQDTGGLTTDTAIIVTITGTNDQPAVNGETFTVDEDNAINFNPLANDSDVDGDTLSITAINIAAADVGNGVLSGPNADGTYTFTPALNFHGAVSIEYTVDDGSGQPNATATATTTINLTPVNDAPVGVDDTASITEGDGPLSGTNVLVNDTDADGAITAGTTHIVTQVNGIAANGTNMAPGAYGSLVMSADGTWTYTLDSRAESLAQGEMADEVFTYTIEDQGAGLPTATAQLTVNVTGQNDNPIANIDVAEINLATQPSIDIDVLANDTDIDGDTLIIDSLVDDMGVVTATTEQGGTIVINGGQVTYTPGTGSFFTSLGSSQQGVDTFHYKVSDGNGGIVTGDAHVLVSGVNDAPVLDLDGATGGEDFAPGAAGAAESETAAETPINLGAGVGVGVSNAADVQDPDAGETFQLITISLADPSDVNDTGGSKGFVGLTDAGTTLASSLGLTVASDGSGGLTISAPAALQNFTAGQAEALVGELRFVNNETTFAMDTDDRSVSVTVRDAGGLDSNVATATIPVVANVTDTGGFNSFVGTVLGDTIDGDTGSDVIAGGVGDDILIGGDEMGTTDTAVYAGARSEFTINAVKDGNGFVTSFDGTDMVVDNDNAVLDEGSDDLTGFERLSFNMGETILDLAQAVQVFDDGGQLVGTFDLINDAINHAVNGANDNYTVLVNGDTYTGSGEDISITEGITLEAFGTLDVTVNSITVSGGGAGQDLVIDNINVDTTANDAITVANTSIFDSITFQNGDVQNAGRRAFEATGTAGVAAFLILSSTFASNGGVGSDGDIFIGQYEGDVTIDNVIITGLGTAEYGINLSGNDGPLNSATVTNVTVTGDYVKGLFALQDFSDINNPNIANVVLDGSATGGNDFSPLFVDIVGGTMDFSGVSFPSAGAGFESYIEQFAATNDTITGTPNDDHILGFGGLDLVIMEDGDDTFTTTSFAGGTVTLDGGAGVDTLSLFNVDGALAPSATQVTFTIGANGNVIVPTTGIDATDVLVQMGDGVTANLYGSVNMDEVENIFVSLGAGGDSVVVTTSLAGTSIAVSTITVVGGIGADDVDAAAIDGAHAVGVSFDAGAGDDMFVSGAGDDTFLGGSDSDTLDLSQATGSVTATTGTGVVTATGTGSDTYSDVENLTGGSADDTLTGDANVNILSGGDGGDTLTGRGGDDILYGGDSAADNSDADIAVYTDTLDVSNFAYGAGVWTVTTTTEGTDMLSGIEFVQHGGVGNILLVDQAGNGGFMTIQTAVDAAGANDVIIVAPGTYNENLVINRSDITLVSVDGSGTTVINPLNATLDAVNINSTFDNVTIGDVGHGFTITGGDGPPAIERAAIYLSGGNDNIVIRGNNLVANGDSALTTTGVVNGLIIDQNELSGQTFTGAGPAGGPGFGDQFTTANVPRQLVVVNSGGTGTEFTNNLVSGTAGGISTTTGNPFGNNLVTIDTSGSTISDNTFTGYTTQDNSSGFFAHSLRVGGDNQIVTDNTVDNSVLGSDSNGITFRTSVTTGTFSGNEFIGDSDTDMVFTTNNATLDAMTLGADTVSGSDGDDTLAAGQGDDTISGNAGDDVLFGQGGADTLLGGDNNDQLYGGAGDDVAIDGGSGDDEIFVYRGEGADQVLGGADSDTVHVKNATFGFSGDTLYGGPGIVFTVSAVADSIGDIGVDDVLVQMGTSIADGSLGSVLMDQVEDIIITLGSGGDSVVVTTPLGGTSLSIATIEVLGGAGADTVDASAIVHNAGFANSEVGVTFTGGDGDDVFVSGAGDDNFVGGDDTDTISYDSASEDMTINLAAGSASDTDGVGDTQNDTISQVENVIGSWFNDTITGDANDNIIFGNGGNDTITDGGTTLGADNDTVVFLGDQSDYTITVDPMTGVFTVLNNLSGDVTTVGNDIEEISFDNANNTPLDTTDDSVINLEFGVRLLDGSNHLVNTYATIQDAVNAASDGNTIQILGRPAAYDGFTVDKSLSFVGIDVGMDSAIVSATSGNAVTISGGLSAGDVSFNGIDLLGAGGSYGINIRPGADVGAFTFENGDISGFTYAGIYTSDNGDPLGTPAMQDIHIIDATFSSNGTGGSNGAGHIKLFGYSGDALFQNIVIEGEAPMTAVASRPDNAIEITGEIVSEATANPPTANSPDIGNVVVDGVTISGEFHKNPVAFFHYTELDGLNIGGAGTTAGLDLSGAVSSWGPLFNIDGVEDDTIDASGYDISFPATSAIHSELQGEKTGQDVVSSTITGTSANDAIMGKTGADTLIGGDGDDRLYGTNKGAPAGDLANDRMTGGAGDDIIVGDGESLNPVATPGEGDVAVYSQAIDASHITALTSDVTIDFTTYTGIKGWTVTTGGAEGTDTLVDVEIIEHDGGAGRILLVGNGGFDTIQAAIDEAADGDTILVAPGTYSGGVSITTANLNIMAAGNPGDVVIAGPLLALIAGSPLNDYFEANHPAYSAATGVSIAADGVSFSGFTLQGFSNAISLATSAGVSISDNRFIDNITGIRKGTAAEVENISINDNTFSQGIHGVTIYAASNGSGAFDSVSFNDNTFSAMSEKGLYFEQLSNATLDGNSFDDVGNYGRVSPPFGGTDGEFGQAIDINLKYETYANVTFTDTTITNSGNSDQDGMGSPGAFGAAIGIKIRDDAPSYSAQPADFTGQIVFDGLSIDGTSTGVRVGEPGKDNQGPDVLLTDVTIANATVTDVENATDPALGGTTSVVLSATQVDLDASASQAPVSVTGNDLANTITGGSADDTLAGGAGNDILIGGDGADAMDGGTGNDTFFVDNSADMVADAAGGGNDTVITTASFTLDPTAEIETLTLTDLASQNLTGNDFAQTITGNAGDNILTGLGDDDTIDGGLGIDTSVYEDVFADYTVTTTKDGNGFVVSFDSVSETGGNMDEGTDTLTGIEVLQFADNTLDLADPVQLFDASDNLIGTFDTIQDAVTAAVAGQTVRLAEGDHTGTVVIDKQLTILGTNAGTPGNGVRSGESNISGAQFHVTADGVVIDGVSFTDGASHLGQLAAVQVQADNVSITNSVFERTGTVDFDTSRGILTAVGDGQGLTITDNAFSGWHTGAFINPGSDATITGNLFDGNKVGVSNDGPDASSIANNIFSNNEFEDVGIGATNDPTTAAFVAGNNTFTGGGIPEVSIYPLAGGVGGQVITGSDNADIFNGDQTDTALGQAFMGGLGDDVANMGGGDDTLGWNIGDGSDTVDGGSGGETLGDLVTIDLDGTANTITIGAAAITVGAETIGYSNVERIEVDALGEDDTIAVDALTGAVLDIDGGTSNPVVFTQMGPGAGVAGGDTLTLAGVTSGTGATVDLNILDTFRETGSAVVHSVAGIENVTGTDYADSITGDGGSNVLLGGDGGDTLSGLGGTDVLIGGAGADTLVAGLGDDHLFGGAGQDTHDVSGGQNTSYFYANDGFDAGNPTSHFDTLNSFSADGASMDTIAIQGGTGVFAGLSAGTFSNANIEFVDIGSYSTVSGQATFILDSTTNSLWYDDAGDGTADFQIVAFGATSSLAGFDEDNILVLDADDVVL